MKLWDVNGTIKCGHRLYNVQKFIVAETYSDAITMYQKEHPHAKCIISAWDELTDHQILEVMDEHHECHCHDHE